MQTLFAPIDAPLPMLFRSEAFAEDLFDSHPGPVTLIGRADERRPGAGSAVQAAAALSLLAALAGCMAPSAAPLNASAQFASDGVQTWPAPQAPFDTTPIGAAETAGAPRTE